MEQNRSIIMDEAAMQRAITRIAFEIIEKNKEKAKKKQEQRGIYENQIREAAAMKTRTIQSKADIGNYADKESKLEAANQARVNAKPGSMAAKANMVREYNERNSRK